MGLWKHLDWHCITCLVIVALKVPFHAKLTKIPLVNRGLTMSQSWSKSSQNNIFHVSTSNLSYSVILVKFDPRLTLESSKNPNFNPTIWTGWVQRHCGDYWILFSTTIHGLKSELKWLRYPENRAKCIITTDPTVGFPISLMF